MEIVHNLEFKNQEKSLTVIGSIATQVDKENKQLFYYDTVDRFNIEVNDYGVSVFDKNHETIMMENKNEI